VYGTITEHAIAFRQNAITSAGAAASRINGADVDTAATASASSSTSVREGWDTALVTTAVATTTG
jgi:hypothetical protein